jgi:uncharacterized protein (DUF433 family)
MKLMATIISDPEIMMGKPVVAGTRITVELILEKLAAGETTTQILAAHPHLTRDGTLAALGICRRGVTGSRRPHAHCDFASSVTERPNSAPAG